MIYWSFKAIFVEPMRLFVSALSLAVSLLWDWKADKIATLPEVNSQLTKVQIGDDVNLLDRTLRVVGLSRNTFAMAHSLVFVSQKDLGYIVVRKNNDTAG